MFNSDNMYKTDTCIASFSQPSCSEKKHFVIIRRRHLQKNIFHFDIVSLTRTLWREKIKRRKKTKSKMILSILLNDHLPLTHSQQSLFLSLTHKSDTVYGVYVYLTAYHQTSGWKRPMLGAKVWNLNKRY